MAQTKTAWKTFDFNQDQVQEQIMSTLRLLFQNISLQLTQNSPFLRSIHDFPASQYSRHTLISEMKNLTVSFLPESFNSEDPDFNQFLGKALIFTYFFVQSYITSLCLLSATWILNRRVLRNDKVSNIVEILFCLILSTPIIPFVLVFSVLILTFRLALYIYLKAVYGDKVSLLSPMDAFWAFECYGNCSSSTGMYVIEGPYDPKKIQERIRDSVGSDLVGGKMHRKIVSCFGYPCWETLKSFDIEDYVKVTLDEKGQINTEDEVFDLFRRVQDKPCNGNKAPWEVFIIPNFEYKNADASSQNTSCTSRYAVVFRIHHSLMDGISTANVLHSTMADKPFKFSVDPISPMGMKQPPLWATIAVHFLGVLSLPRIGLRNLLLQDTNKYYLPGPFLTGPKTFSWTRPMKVSALKTVKNATKTSVFAVLLTALGGAFRKVSLHNGQTPDPRIHAMAPVALLPYPDRRPKNRFTGILVPVSTGGNNLSTEDRLVVTHKTVYKLWNSLGSVNATANWYYPLICGMLPLCMHKLLGKTVSVRSSLSNIPGPAETVWIFGGGKIIDIAVWVPIKMCVGMGMGVFTYGDRVRATIVGDKAYFPKDSDIYMIRDAFEEELCDMASAYGNDDVFIKE